MRKDLVCLLLTCCLLLSLSGCKTKQEDEARGAGDRLGKSVEEKNKAAQEIPDDTQSDSSSEPSE